MSEQGNLVQILTRLGMSSEEAASIVGAIASLAIQTGEIVANAECIEQKRILFNVKSYANYVPAILVSYTIDKATYRSLATGDTLQNNLSLFKKLTKQGIIVFKIVVPQDKIPSNVTESSPSTLYSSTYYLGGIPYFVVEPPIEYRISQFGASSEIRYSRNFINSLGLKPNSVQLLPIKEIVKNPSPNPNLHSPNCFGNVTFPDFLKIVIMPNFTPNMFECVRDITKSLNSNLYIEKYIHITFNSDFSACFDSTTRALTNTPFLIPSSFRFNPVISQLGFAGPCGIGGSYLDGNNISTYKSSAVVEIDDSTIGSPIYYTNNCLANPFECKGLYLVGFLSSYFKFLSPGHVNYEGETIVFSPGSAIYCLVRPPNKWSFDALMQWASAMGENVPAVYDIIGADVVLQALRNILSSLNHPFLGQAIYGSMPLLEGLLNIDVKGFANDIVSAFRSTGIAGIINYIKNSLSMADEDLEHFATNFSATMRIYGY